jgi:hypothetical protein
MRQRIQGIFIGALAVLLLIGAGEYLARAPEPVHAATAEATVARFRSEVGVFLDALRNASQRRSDMVVQGGASFVSPIVDDPDGAGPEPDPDPDISSTDIIAAAQAIQAIKQLLADNGNEHLEALLKVGR